MKSKVLIVVLLLVIVVAVVGWQAANQKDAEIVPSQQAYRALSLSVKGMVCPQCASTINTFLESKEGIVQAAIDYKEGGGIVVYDPKKIDKEKILSFGILKDFYTAEFVSDNIFAGEIKQKNVDVSPQVAAGERKLKEASATLQLFLIARQKNDEFYIQNLKEEYFSLVDELKELDSQIEGEDERREFRKKVLAETADQIYLLRPSLPGEPAYEIKKKAEEIQITLAVNPVLKTKSVFLAGNSRINEASALFSENDGALDETIQSLIAQYKDSLAQSITLLETIEKKGETNKQLLVFGESVKELIREQLPKQEILLEELYDSVPFDIQEIIQKLLTAAS